MEYWAQAKFQKMGRRRIKERSPEPVQEGKEEGVGGSATPRQEEETLFTVTREVLRFLPSQYFLSNKKLIYIKMWP